jgi:hypothetical protein
MCCGTLTDVILALGGGGGAEKQTACRYWRSQVQRVYALWRETVFVPLFFCPIWCAVRTVVSMCCALCTAVCTVVYLNMLQKYLVPFPKFYPIKRKNSIFCVQFGTCWTQISHVKRLRDAAFSLCHLLPLIWYQFISSSRVHKEIGVLFIFHHWPSVLPEISGRIWGAASTVRHDSYGAYNSVFIEHMKTAKLKSPNFIILSIEIFLVDSLPLSSRAALHEICPRFVCVIHVVWWVSEWVKERTNFFVLCGLQSEVKKKSVHRKGY